MQVYSRLFEAAEAAKFTLSSGKIRLEYTRRTLHNHDDFSFILFSYNFLVSYLFYFVIISLHHYTVFTLSTFLLHSNPPRTRGHNQHTVSIRRQLTPMRSYTVISLPKTSSFSHFSPHSSILILQCLVLMCY
jgi:hypothetical protein